MKLFRKRQIDLIPSVPSDMTDRREAIRRAQQKLAQAQSSIPEALRVVKAVESHDAENHYAQRLRHAYGVGE